MTNHVRIESGDLHPDQELAAFLGSLADDGAVVSFTGVVRPTSKSGTPITGLYLDHYPALTQASLVGIAADAMQKFSISRAHIVHRCGLVAVNCPIVFAAAASAHRRVAFEAVDYLMDRLKTDAAFWKREEADSQSIWIEPTSQDRVDRGRW